MKKWSIRVGVAAALLLALTAPSRAGEIGGGGGINSGHSESGTYSIDSGHSFYTTIESGEEFSFGLMYVYSHFLKTDNNPTRRDQINSHKLLGFSRWYPDFSEELRPFLTGGVGYEFADDKNNPLLAAGAGVSYWITPTFGIEGGYNYMLRPDRNYHVTLFGLKYRF